MTVHPKGQKDLMLAPVAVEIDHNLQRIRDRSIRDVAVQLEFELDTRAMNVDRKERFELVLRQALRDVNMHGWSAEITDDASSIHLVGGSVTIDLGLGGNVQAYIRDGVGTGPAAPVAGGVSANGR